MMDGFAENLCSLRNLPSHPHIYIKPVNHLATSTNFCECSRYLSPCRNVHLHFRDGSQMLQVHIPFCCRGSFLVHETWKENYLALLWLPTKTGVLGLLPFFSVNCRFLCSHFSVWELRIHLQRILSTSSGDQLLHT